MKLQRGKAKNEEQMKTRVKEGFISLPLCLSRTNSGSLTDLNANQCVSVSAKCSPRSHIMLTQSIVGSVQGDWLSQAKPDIEARMGQYEEGQIEFAILSLIRDPLLEMVPALAENVRAMDALSTRLDIVEPGWKDFVDHENVVTGGLITSPNLAYGLTQEMLNQAEVSHAVDLLCHCDVASDILGHRERLIDTQMGLRMSIREEIQANQSDEERAAARTCDYGAMMQNFVRKMRDKKQSLKEFEA